MDEDAIRQVVRSVLNSKESGMEMEKEILLETSARHVHLTQEAVTALFGDDALLGTVRALSQPGEFLSDKRVKLITPAGAIENVAVLGPVRKAVQVELSATDCRVLGLKAPVNLSGNLDNAADVVLLGSRGLYEAAGSVIVAKAHAHLTKADAAAFGVADGQSVSVRIEGTRSVTFEDVIVRVKDTYKAAVHIDADEGNACGAADGVTAYLRGTRRVGVVGDVVLPTADMSWSEKLVNEKTASQLACVHAGGTVRFSLGTVVTPAARDVLHEARIAIEYV